MAYYDTCPACGANLDPGERCDCTGERKPSLFNGHANSAQADVKFFSVAALATRWAVSVDLVYDLLRNGKVAAMKLGGSWRIPISAVEQFEAANLFGAHDDFKSSKGARRKRKPVLRL